MQSKGFELEELLFSILGENCLTESDIIKISKEIRSIDFMQIVTDNSLITIQCKDTVNNDYHKVISFNEQSNKLARMINLNIKYKIWISRNKLSGLSKQIAEEYNIKNILISELDNLKSLINVTQE